MFRLRLLPAVAGSVFLFLAVTLASAQTANQLFFDGFELLKSGKAGEAAVKFEEGLKAEPNNAVARYYLGEAYFADGQKDKALEQWRKSLYLDATSKVAEDAFKRLAEVSGNAFANAGTENFPAAGTVIRDCPLCPVMVVVPAGQFEMGSPPSELDRSMPEDPRHVVSIAKPFAVGKYEVTFLEWETCMADQACAQVDDMGWGRGRRPVINIDYEQAVGYAKWLSKKTGKNYRLLSEAEWEYSARAGTDTARFWGNGTVRACEFANVFDVSAEVDLEAVLEGKLPWKSMNCDDTYVNTAPVGSFKANAFGLHDMLGNVWEWVEDCWNDNYSGAPNDGRAWLTGDCSQHIRRGGGSSFNHPYTVRSAFRLWDKLSFRSDELGFRLARTLP
jgi:formylglycine-generating enzyme required for sulfatase activity